MAFELGMVLVMHDNGLMQIPTSNQVFKSLERFLLGDVPIFSVLSSYLYFGERGQIFHIILCLTISLEPENPATRSMSSACCRIEQRASFKSEPLLRRTAKHSIYWVD
jgi:hypothetical protein